MTYGLVTKDGETVFRCSIIPFDQYSASMHLPCKFIDVETIDINSMLSPGPVRLGFIIDGGKGLPLWARPEEGVMVP